MATVVIGAGAPMVERASSLSEFQSGTSRAAQAQEYIAENFSDDSANTTSVQIIVRGDNVFSKKSLLRQFGIITGLTIIYAFVASVFVLPSLLIIWTHWFGPDDALSTWGGFEKRSGEETPSINND